MGNTWSLEFSLGRVVAEDDLHGAIQALAAASGAPNTSTVPSIVVEADWFSERRYQNLSDAVAYVCASGGLLTVWNGDRDYHFAVDPNGRSLRISILHELREDRPEDAITSTILSDLFSIACERLRPIHAYAIDELLLEAASGSDLQRIVADLAAVPSAGRPPPMLFWLNFFESEYFAECVASALPSRGCDVTRSTNGAAVRLGRWPWNTGIAVLGPGNRYAEPCPG
jgi:hypothetical protein